MPILVHLTARDRRNVVRFPSLKFLTRLPYRQVRRQRIRHPLLFAMRALAIVLLVLAFSRPLLRGASAVGAGDGGREVIVALDVSYSMAYGDTWERAVGAVRDAVAALPPASRVSLLTFAEDAQVVAAPAADAQVLTQALDELTPGSGRTRLTPALQAANEILLESPLADREVVLVSDLQARAWDRSERTQLIPGAGLTTADLSIRNPANVLIASVDVRGNPDDDSTTTITVRLVNQAPDPVADLPVTVLMDGREAASERVTLEPSGSGTVQLGPLSPWGERGGAIQPQPSALTRVTVGIDRDKLEPDNAFHLTLSPRPALPVLLIEARDARDDASLYLREALAVAEEPAFEVVSKRENQVRPADVESVSLVIVHDSPFPGGAAGQALADGVAAGAGLWVILGSRSGVAEDTPLLPGRWRETVDRLEAQGVSLASVDYDHPVFEVFSAPDAGNVAGPRFYRYRPIVLEEGDGASAVARYTDGAVALAARRHGEGRVLLWGSPLDNRWSNLPLQPVFLPFVHQVCQFLGGREAVDPWRQVGEALNLRQLFAEMDVDADSLEGAVVVATPSGSEQEIRLDGEAFVTLTEAGFYQVRLPNQAPIPVAVNVDRAESDLTRLDPEAFVAASTAPATTEPGAPAAAGMRTLTLEERERRQGTWWYLVLVALLLLAAESMWSNRPAQTHPKA